MTSTGKTYTIPETPSASVLESARYYWRELGWAVHPLFGPQAKNCDPKQCGKAPVRSGWPSHTANNVTDAMLAEWFGTGDHNLGVVVRPPFVVIDLDSKADQGASVMRFLEAQPSLANVPRERTAGGAHLYFICHDLPQFEKKNGTARRNAVSHRINDQVTAELFFNGQNIVVSPSIHVSGHRYQWQVTGEIPEIAWADLQRIFGFRASETPAPDKQTTAPWWTRYDGDLKTLDIVALTTEAGLYVKKLEAGKHSIHCPWAKSHSEATGGADSSTVIFEAGQNTLPNWKCLHQTHGDKSFEDLLLWVEERHPGLVDRHCSQMRVWQPGQKDSRGRVKIPINKELSLFAEGIGRIIGPRHVWFMKGDAIVDVRDQQLSTKIRCTSFHPITATETRTLVEDHVQIGRMSKDKDGKLVFTPQSMSREEASAVLVSCQLQRQLPRIERILDVPVPLIRDGKLVYPKSGYDPELMTYCLPGTLEIKPLPLEESKRVLLQVHAEFCFKDGELSRTLAIARLLTAFSRGLMGWDARMPVWVFEANRPRAGKDYLAAITQIVFEGRTNEDAPLDSNSEETCKRIMSALRAGRRRMHFANCKGHIANGPFEQAITSKVFSARNLGKNDAASDLTLPNEIEFSLSGNIGVSFSEDLDQRCRRISLHYSEEDANARKFKTPDLHSYVLAQRWMILNALAGLVQHWFDQGCPSGPTPFTSFPEWSRVVGGIMTCCGLGDPCVTQQDGNLTADQTTEDMKELYRLANVVYGNDWIQKKDIYSLLKDSDLFGWWNLDERKGQTCFGNKLLAFHDRELGGIRMTIDKTDKSRPKYRFAAKEGQMAAGGPPAGKPVRGGESFTTVVCPSCEPCEPCEPPYPLSSLKNTHTHMSPTYTNPYMGCGAGIEVREVREVCTTDINQDKEAMVCSE